MKEESKNRAPTLMTAHVGVAVFVYAAQSSAFELGCRTSGILISGRPSSDVVVRLQQQLRKFFHFEGLAVSTAGIDLTTVVTKRGLRSFVGVPQNSLNLKPNKNKNKDTYILTIQSFFLY